MSAASDWARDHQPNQPSSPSPPSQPNKEIKEALSRTDVAVPSNRGYDVSVKQGGRGGRSYSDIIASAQGNDKDLLIAQKAEEAKQQESLKQQAAAQEKRIIEGKERAAEQAAIIKQAQERTIQSQGFQQLAELRRQELLSKAGKEAELAHTPQTFVNVDNKLYKKEAQVSGEEKGFYKPKQATSKKAMQEVKPLPMPEYLQEEIRAKQGEKLIPQTAIYTPPATPVKYEPLELSPEVKAGIRQQLYEQPFIITKVSAPIEKVQYIKPESPLVKIGRVLEPTFPVQITKGIYEIASLEVRSVGLSIKEVGAGFTPVEIAKFRVEDVIQTYSKPEVQMVGITGGAIALSIASLPIGALIYSGALGMQAVSIAEKPTIPKIIDIGLMAAPALIVKGREFIFEQKIKAFERNLPKFKWEGNTYLSTEKTYVLGIKDGKVVVERIIVEVARTEGYPVLERAPTPTGLISRVQTTLIPKSEFAKLIEYMPSNIETIELKPEFRQKTLIEEEMQAVFIKKDTRSLPYSLRQDTEIPFTFKIEKIKAPSPQPVKLKSESQEVLSTFFNKEGQFTLGYAKPKYKMKPFERPKAKSDFKPIEVSQERTGQKLILEPPEVKAAELRAKDLFAGDVKFQEPVTARPLFGKGAGGVIYDKGMSSIPLFGKEKERQRIENIAKIGQGWNQGQRNRQEERVMPVFNFRTDLTSELQSRPISKPKVNLDIGIAAITKPRQEYKIKPIIIPSFKQGEDIISIPKISLDLRPRQKERFEPEREEPPMTEEPKPLRLHLDLEGSPFLKKQVGYDAYVVERGRNVKVNKKPLPKTNAMNLGFEAADNTPSRTVKIKKSGMTEEIESGLNFSLFDKFKKKSENTFVEKTTYAIDTEGELQGITVKGWLANKMKSNLGINFSKLF